MADLDAPRRRKRAILYCRISDARASLSRPTVDLKALTKEERLELLERGVNRQLAECLGVATNLDVVVVEQFKENDLSAYKPNVVRPKFERTLEMVRNGEADMIIVWHLDRYLRRTKQLQRLIDAAEQYKVEIVGATSGTIDISTPTGRMIARSLVNIAEYESEHHAERRILANKHRAEHGVWETCVRPFGYTQDGRPHPVESDLFRKAVVGILGGQSIRSFARQWDADGVTTPFGNKWNVGTIRKMIRNPRYAGLKVHRGTTYPGKWEPLIDVDTHHAIVHFLNNPERLNGRVSFEQTHLGAGLYICGVCGATMRSRAQGGGRPFLYACRTAEGHASCKGVTMDEWVQVRILDWFARAECHLLIDTPHNLSELAVRKSAIIAEQRTLTKAKNERRLTLQQVLDLSEPLNEELAEIERHLTAAASTTAAGALIAISQEAHRAGKDALQAISELWGTMSVTQRAQAIAEVATVTITPVLQRGWAYASPDGRTDVVSLHAPRYFAALPVPAAPPSALPQGRGPRSRALSL